MNVHNKLIAWNDAHPVDKMGRLLEAVQQPIQACVWDWYPNDGARIDPYTGIAECAGLMYGCGNAGNIESLKVWGVLPSRKQTAKILAAKPSAAAEHSALTSLQVRNMKSDPKVWGGASEVLGARGLYDAVSGDQELVDHLKVCLAQYYCGRLNVGACQARIHEDYAGMQAARAKTDMSVETYLAMRERISGIFNWTHMCLST